jgi:hypothetical protein
MPDHLGKIWEENRYQILDEDGMDSRGEHVSLDSCSDIIEKGHELWSEVGTYADYGIAKEQRDRGNTFFEETQQNLINIIVQFEGSKVCSVKTYRL